jgi:hypothetical protein
MHDLKRILIQISVIFSVYHYKTSILVNTSLIKSDELERNLNGGISDSETAVDESEINHLNIWDELEIYSKNGNSTEVERILSSIKQSIHNAKNVATQSNYHDIMEILNNNNQSSSEEDFDDLNSMDSHIFDVYDEFEKASKKGNAPYIKFVMNKLKQSICNGMNSASENGHYNVVENYINCDQDIFLDLNCKNTALRSASMNGNKNIVELLLENGADNIYSALEAVLSNANNKVVQLLLDYESKRNNGIRNLVDAASINGNMEIVRILIKYGVSSEDLNSAVKLARDNNKWDVVRYLIENGGIINFTIDSGSEKHIKWVHLKSENDNTEIKIKCTEVFQVSNLCSKIVLESRDDKSSVFNFSSDDQNNNKNELDLTMKVYPDRDFYLPRVIFSKNIASIYNFLFEPLISGYIENNCTIDKCDIGPVLNDIQYMMKHISSNFETVSKIFEAIKQKDKIKNSSNIFDLMNQFDNIKRKFSLIFVSHKIHEENQESNNLEIFSSHSENYSYLLNRLERDKFNWNHIHNKDRKKFYFGPEFTKQHVTSKGFFKGDEVKYSLLSLAPISGTVAIIDNKDKFIVDTTITTINNKAYNKDDALWMGGFCFNLKIFNDQSGNYLFYTVESKILRFSDKYEKNNEESGLCFVFARHQNRMKNVDDNDKFNGIKWTEMLYNMVRYLIHVEIENSQNHTITLKKITRAIAKYLNSMRERALTMPRDNVNDWLVQNNFDPPTKWIEYGKFALEGVFKTIVSVGLFGFGPVRATLEQIKGVMSDSRNTPIMDSQVILEDSPDATYIPGLMQKTFDKHEFLKISLDDLNKKDSIYKKEGLRSKVLDLHLVDMKKRSLMLLENFTEYLKFKVFDNQLTLFLKSSSFSLLPDYQIKLKIIDSVNDFISEFSEEYSNHIKIFGKLMLAYVEDDEKKTFIEKWLIEFDLMNFKSKFSDFSDFSYLQFIQLIENKIFTDEEDKKKFKGIITYINSSHRETMINECILAGQHPALIYFDQSVQYQLVFDIITKILARTAQKSEFELDFVFQNYSKILFEDVANIFLTTQFILSTAEIEYTYSERIFHADGFGIELLKKIALDSKAIVPPKPSDRKNAKGYVPNKFWYNVPFGSWAYKIWLHEEVVHLSLSNDKDKALNQIDKQKNPNYELGFRSTIFSSTNIETKEA